MSKIKKLCISMFKIGIIGFGGGNALIPVIEKAAIEEQDLIKKDDYDVDVMIASITPGALPVEISAGIGRRICGSKGLLLGATSMALPGVILTIILSSLMLNINSNLLTQIGFVTIGIYAYICCVLMDYIYRTIKNSGSNREKITRLLIISCVFLLVCGKNVFKLMSWGNIPNICLSTVNIFSMFFFIILFTRCELNSIKIVISCGCCFLFVLSHCSIGSNIDVVIKYGNYILMIVLAAWEGIQDLKNNKKNDDNGNKIFWVNTIKEFIICFLFVFILGLPAFFLIKNINMFIYNGFLSSVMSFGGGDAYLTVADGLFVETGMISEYYFYSRLVPIVNVLPGSILCKTLSGVGYYLGVNCTGNILGGIVVALLGFSISVAASCIVFSIVSALYGYFGSVTFFDSIKRWIRTIVSGLLINVILSIVVQVKNMEHELKCNYFIILTLILVMIIDKLLEKKLHLKNELIVMISIFLSVVVCNLFMIV